MNTVTFRPDRPLTLLAFVVFLIGCQHLNSLRLEQDQPGDLGTLMVNHEYGRAEQLLHQYPYLDTAQTRRDFNEQVAAYETAVLSEAQTRESANDLYGAHELLDEALQRLPDSSRLSEYKHQLDAKRSERLKENELRELLAQAEYYVAQQEIYNEHRNLDSPSLIERWKIRLMQQQTQDLAERLMQCVHESLERDDIDMEDACLHYAQIIKDGPEVQAALAQLESRREAERQNEEKKALVSQIREEKKLARKNKNKSQEVLGKTKQALNDNDLATAHRVFRELPKSGNESREVVAVRTRLNDAIQSRVRELTREGDRLYRADNVRRAIHTWEHALDMDPDNPELIKRLERARKVLARLEELKNRQRAPVKQSELGT